MIKLEQTDAITDAERFAQIPALDNFRPRGFLTFRNNFDWNNDAASHPYTSAEFKTSGAPPLSDQFSYVTTPTNPYVGGAFVGQFDVRSGDQFGSSTGERLEMVINPSGEGVRHISWTWYDFWWQSGQTLPSQWLIKKQWHSDARFQQAALKAYLMADGNVDFVFTCGPFADAAQALAPIESNNFRLTDLFAYTTNVWHQIIVGVGWSHTGNGWVRIYHKTPATSSWGAPVADASGIYTIPTTIGDSTPGTIYDKIGPYRNTSAFTNTVYYARHWKANSLADLLNYSGTTVRKSVGFYGAYDPIMSNSDMESGLTGWVENGAGVTKTYKTDHSILGKCVEVFLPGSASSESLKTSTAPTLVNGTWYAAVATVVVPQGQRLRLYMVDSTSANLSPIHSITGNGEMQELEIIFQANANQPTNLRVGRTATGSAFTFWVKAIQIRKAAKTAIPRVPTNGSTPIRSSTAAYIPRGRATPSAGCFACVLEPQFAWNQDLDANPNLFYFEATNGGPEFLHCYYDEATASWVLKRANNSGNSTVSQQCYFLKNQRVRLAGLWTPSTIKISCNGYPAASAGNTYTHPLYENQGRMGYLLESEVYWFAMGAGSWQDSDLDEIFASEKDPPLRSAIPAAFDVDYVMGGNGVADSNEHKVMVTPVGY